MTTDRRFDIFDPYVDDYRAIHTKNVRISGADSDYFSKYRVEEIFWYEKKLGQKTVEGANFTLLDIGSGDGNAARYFREYFKGSFIEGIDITEKVVRNASERNLDQTRFRVYDGENIPFESEWFDMIFLVGTLHHVHKTYHEKLMQEAYRVLKTGGRMYHFEHNPWNPLTQKLVRDCPFDTEAVLVPAPYLAALEKKLGFKNVQVRFTLFFPRFKVFRPFLWIEKHLHRLPLGGQYYVFATK